MGWCVACGLLSAEELGEVYGIAWFLSWARGFIKREDELKRCGIDRRDTSLMCRELLGMLLGLVEGGYIVVVLFFLYFFYEFFWGVDLSGAIWISCIILYVYGGYISVVNYIVSFC